MDINARVKQVRQELKISQAKFADTISISNGFIAGIELGNRKVNDRIVKLIASEFNVNEDWLKTGDGEMFKEAQDQSYNKALDIFKNLNPTYQKYVLQQMENLVELQKEQSKTPSNEEI